jgi:hypothetical protein
MDWDYFLMEAAMWLAVLGGLISCIPRKSREGHH